MCDLAEPNAEPGPCRKCHGTGFYQWGTVVNGKCRESGPCHSCRGTGHQTAADIRQNEAYNRYKINEIFRADFARVDAMD